MAQYEMRFLVYVAVASVAVYCSAVNAQANKNIEKAFKVFNYVPDILLEEPDNLLKVYYPSIDACLGNVISQTRLSLQPKIDYYLKPGVNYTLIMFDPDVSSAQAPVLRNYLVWFVVDINKGCETGEIIAKYATPSPYPGSGPHRYTILLYEQTKPIDVAALLSCRYGVKRYKFNVVAVAKDYGLKLVAGNFFITEMPAFYDEYYCSSVSCADIASSL